MGTNLVIPSVMRAKRVVTIFEPENDLRFLIHEYMGDEIRDLYSEVVDNAREGEDVSVDGYPLLKNVLNKLDELLGQKHIKKEEIGKICDEIRRVI